MHVIYIPLIKIKIITESQFEDLIVEKFVNLLLFNIYFRYHTRYSLFSKLINVSNSFYKCIH